jgi:hypothetical protein
MEGTALIPGIYASTKEKSKFKYVMFSAVTLDGILSLCVSTIGYLAYGSFIREIVIMNLSYGIASNLVQLSFSFGVLCTFVL